MTNKSNINIEMSWDRLVVPSKTQSERSLLIELTASNNSEVKKKDRPPVNLALVIDRSGSMKGSPIKAAKIAATKITEQLTSKDRLSLVSFDSEVINHFSNIQMDNEGSRYAKRMISELYARSMTNLSGGWFEGASCATKAIDEGTFNDGYVIVLSDGMANEGIQDPKELKMHAHELASRGIQTSSVGIGADYSPLQLDALAEGGEGRLLKVTSSGDIMVLARGLGRPNGVVVAGDGSCYVSEPDKGQVSHVNDGTSTLIEGLSSPQGLALLGDQLLIVDSGSKELIAVSLATKQRQTIGSNLPVGAQPGVTPQPLMGIAGLIQGPLTSFSGLTVGNDGTVYIAADGEGSVLTLKQT